MANDPGFRAASAQAWYDTEAGLLLMLVKNEQGGELRVILPAALVPSLVEQLSLGHWNAMQAWGKRTQAKIDAWQGIKGGPD